MVKVYSRFLNEANFLNCRIPIREDEAKRALCAKKGRLIVNARI
jgi:hypothetical protein